VAIQRRALVLNQNYEPLNVCSVRRAFVLVYRGTAEMLETGDEPLHGVDGATFATPSVIRLQHFISRPLPRPRLTRREIFNRDRERCQYCGKSGGDLTLDHVLPKHRGGAHVWENLVTACRSCNHRKGGRTPSEARMHLVREPQAPSHGPGDMLVHYLDRYREWHPFLLGWTSDRNAQEGAFAAS
jgi:5-methylcytosine-specific restriction endonuclease McrA